MFAEFRQIVRTNLDKRKMTYRQLSEKTDIEESTIKCFMCGANDSRRVAEKIADALGMTLMYSNGVYRISENAGK